MTYSGGKGWPVPTPQGVAERDAIYVLFDYVGGTSSGGRSAAAHRRIGRLLAEFHQDMREFTGPQCPGRVAFIDSAGRASPESTIDATILSQARAAVPERIRHRARSRGGVCGSPSVTGEDNATPLHSR